MKQILLRNAQIFRELDLSLQNRDVAVYQGRLESIPLQVMQEDRLQTNLEQILVIPPLVDFNCHIYYQGSGISFNPEHLPTQGVLYACDGGSAGISSVTGLAHYAVNMQHSVELRYWLNLSPFGIHENCYELQTIANIERLSLKSLNKLMRKRMIGITVRLTHQAMRDSIVANQALERAISLCEELDVPLMVSISQPCFPVDLILSRLRPNDVVSEIYHNFGEGILDAKGKVRRSFLEARERGVKFDLAHGISSFDFNIASQSIQQGFLPDFISTNATSRSYLQKPVYGLTNIMSKMLMMGVPLTEVIARATVYPARYLDIKNYPYNLNSLEQDSLVCLALQEGNWPFFDSSGTKLSGNQLLEPFLVYQKGRLIYRKESVVLDEFDYNEKN